MLFRFWKSLRIEPIKSVNLLHIGMDSEDHDDQQDAEHQYQLGISYCMGKGRPKDTAEGAKCLELAAERGHMAAKRDLGILYLTGDGVEADVSKAYALISEAARTMVDPSAMYHLALMYEKGMGVDQDRYEAMKLISYAAIMGYPGADIDAERMEGILADNRKKRLGSRPLLNLEVSDVDVEASCCKRMLDDMLDGRAYVVDTYEGPELVMLNEVDGEAPIRECPYCKKKARRVTRDKKY
jgi:uncharacterized protein